MVTLVIVESPSKTAKLEKILGSGFKVLASFGHVRDLPEKELGVDLKTLKPVYRVTGGKAVKNIRRYLAKADRVLLATDPDREGEAIAWHLAEVLKPGVPMFRMTFNSITEQAVKSAAQNLRQIDMSLVSAQETRRVLDRLIGYKVSDLLRTSFDSNVSAGRVQSVALRMVVERQEMIDAFIAKDYFELEATVEARSMAFRLRLTEWLGQSVDNTSFSNQHSLNEIINLVQKERWQVDELSLVSKKIAPKEPFTTSSLQQAASSYLNYSPEKTMSLAQSLYQAGVITYMRTDSPSVSSEGMAMAASFIEKKFGRDYLPKNQRVFQSKGNAQEAHEAIRPTDLLLQNISNRDGMTSEMAQLYELIWRRFVASQMAEAVDDETKVIVVLAKGKAKFEALGRQQRFDGWRRVYSFGEDEGNDSDEDESLVKLPLLQHGDILKLIALTPSQKKTKAPKSYTEASLVRALEKQGIGRPSTFASTIQTLKKRKYILLKKKAVVPTDLGRQVSTFLVAEFPQLFDLKYTADLETCLDSIAMGKDSAHRFLMTFWKQFSAWLFEVEAHVRQTISERDVQVPKCPACGQPMRLRESKRGQFFGCSKYPLCRGILSVSVGS